MSVPTYQSPHTPTPPAVEVLTVFDKKVWCDGTLRPDGTQRSKALGHPKVYLNMGKQDWVDCSYCGKRFALESYSASE